MKTETNLPERCVGDIERFKAVSACDQWASCAINSHTALSAAATAVRERSSLDSTESFSLKPSVSTRIKRLPRDKRRSSICKINNFPENPSQEQVSVASSATVSQCSMRIDILCSAPERVKNAPQIVD